MTRIALRFAPLLLLAPMSYAQIPDGWYVYGAFAPRHGPIGVFLSHPRNPGTPTEITNLQGDLTVTGSSCIVYRRSDGAILVGERAPTGSSVDLHVIWLNGTSVMLDACFSMGTGGPCCGEIPQIGLELVHASLSWPKKPCDYRGSRPKLTAGSAGIRRWHLSAPKLQFQRQSE